MTQSDCPGQLLDLVKTLIENSGLDVGYPVTSLSTMREVLLLCAGWVCVQIWNNWWDLSYIQPDGQVPSDKTTGVCNDAFNALFLETGAGKHVPPDVFVKPDPTVVDEAHGGTSRQLFHSKQIISTPKQSINSKQLVSRPSRSLHLTQITRPQAANPHPKQLISTSIRLLHPKRITRA